MLLNTALITLLSSSSFVTARHQWFERDNKNGPIFLHPRRFGQQNPALLNELGQACPGQFCGTLAGEAVSPLLAGAAECTQQQHADKIIDTAQQFDAATKAKMIELAIAYRQLEKNTPPDFTTNPPSLRNSVFCQEAPKNPELNGLVQAQDPANDPDLFFDPATKATVRKGEQANTAPFGGAAAQPPANNAGNGGAAGNNGGDNEDDDNTGNNAGNGAASSCAATVTVTATGNAVASPTGAVTVTAGNTPAATGAPDAGNAGDIGDFGICSVPEIEFGVGFDGRRESAFRPVDQASFPHGSAQNIAIITRSVCDQLVNTCKADDTAKATCQTATDAANAQPAKTGAQADAFNAVFGKTTNFAAVTAVDDQGRPVPGTGAGNGNTGNGNAGNGNAGNGNASNGNGATPPATGGNGNIGDFGICTPPQIEFGAGFDNRRETAFRPVDQVSFPKESAQNGAIVTQFLCDQLVNKCGADATAQATCATAEAEFLKGADKTGEQADLFNAVFGITTNFAAVDVIDNQGNVVQAGNGGNAGNGNNNNNNGNAGNGNNGGAATTTAAAPAATAPAPAAGNLQKFTGALGGVVAPSVTDIGGGRFQVTGNASFNNLESALVRSCDVHNNQCANAANASGNQNGFNVGACNQQQQQCIALARA